MAYLQITTRCNMACAHCCYSCAPNKGKHGDYQLLRDAINFAWEQDSGALSIGGGEPTIHPRFFDLLKHAVNMDFDYIWMATNGKKTKAALRLADIMLGQDLDNFDYDEDCCYDDCIMVDNNRFTVALSQDPWHDPIERRVVDTWRRHKWEIRNVSLSRDGAVAVGRAKRTRVGSANHCVCSDLIIKPDGTLRLCGCTNAPKIGDIWSGIESRWEDFMQTDDFMDTNCFNGR